MHYDQHKYHTSILYILYVLVFLTVIIHGLCSSRLKKSPLGLKTAFTQHKYPVLPTKMKKHRPQTATLHVLEALVEHLGYCRARII